MAVKHASDKSAVRASIQGGRSARDRTQGRRSLIGAVLAAIIAFILIGLILSGISILGQRRLSQLRDQAILPSPPRHTVHPAPGLGAPAPLVEHPNRMQAPAPIVPLADPAPLAALPAPIDSVLRPIIPSAPPPAPTPLPPASLPPAVRALAQLEFSRIREAILARPDTRVNPSQFQRPQVTDNFIQIYRESRPAPETIREIVESRRPLPTLAERRAQALLARASAPTTKPSD